MKIKVLENGRHIQDLKWNLTYEKFSRTMFTPLQHHLGEPDGENGMGAAAVLIHACAACGAVVIAKNNQVLHVTVVVNQVL